MMRRRQAAIGLDWLAIAVRSGPLASLFAIALLVGGCRSATVQVDRELARQSSRADQAFHDGDDAEALLRYRAALRRAWEQDDIEAIANTAYNLAAALAANRRFDEARQALAESRAELNRGRLHAADAWLLEAKIARAEGRLAEAAYYADCVVAPLVRHCSQSCRQATTGDAEQRSCQRDDKCAECQMSAVSLALLRANLGLDRGEIASARAELRRALANRPAASDPGVRAEIAAVQARLLLANGQPLAAARRLDEEVRWLKEAAHYRELPVAMAAAAEAFLEADLPLEASERYFRAARVLYGRGDLMAALDFLGSSVELSFMLEDVELQQRSGLLLSEIERASPTTRRRRSAALRDESPPQSDPPLQQPTEPAATPQDAPVSRIDPPPLDAARQDVVRQDGDHGNNDAQVDPRELLLRIRRSLSTASSLSDG